MKMRAARMHGYNRPLEIDEVPVPDVGRNQVLIKVAATGMCRSDYQLVDGYFRDGLPVEFPSSRDTKCPALSPRWVLTFRSRPASPKAISSLSTRTGATVPVGNAMRATNNSVPMDNSSVSGLTAVSPNTWSPRTTTSFPLATNQIKSPGTLPR